MANGDRPDENPGGAMNVSEADIGENEERPQSNSLPNNLQSTNSPQKQIVRIMWDTPILEAVHAEFGINYIYCGLPGFEAIDIGLWQSMIRRVIAFQAEDEDGAEPRRTLVELNRNLQLMGYYDSVYCGYMENVILRGRDDDGETYEQDEFVTLFNLDFCDTITSRVPTSEGSKCRRFNALREIMSKQRQLHNATGESRFILLLTVREEFHAYQMRRFIQSQDLPAATSRYLRNLPPTRTFDNGMQRSPAHLKAFVFTTLRTYCGANNVSTFFLPVVRYVGRSVRSNMMHFVVLCYCHQTEEALPIEMQTPGAFLRRTCYRATDNDISVEPCCPWETNQSEIDINQITLRFFRRRVR